MTTRVSFFDRSGTRSTNERLVESRGKTAVFSSTTSPASRLTRIRTLSTGTLARTRAPGAKAGAMASEARGDSSGPVRPRQAAAAAIRTAVRRGYLRDERACNTDVARFLQSH